MSYAIALIHEEDGVFGISFPDFPGCVSTGATLDEAMARGAQALTFHIEGMVEDEESLPLLRTPAQIKADPELAEDTAGAVLVAVPVELPGKAVRVNITLDEHLLAAIDRAAGAQGSSRSGFLAEAARRRLGR
ncbi:type II toxin-antitoxin system HicB family antitoxin [Chelativorans alearense]|uniref:type II toxin-antitoxin system HicB family antitoxin n=1 Tax=Chelativorans alearense TaxID=2681495 RepID=UPI0013D48463|nr:type II toxin-antitoxin system HicB family antitoxin [Chelativorans alearense]